MKKYYSLAAAEREADIYIFGDIVTPAEQEFFGFESDVSGYSLVSEIKGLDVDVINVHINSYGGVVSEGLAIYNTLKNHKAEVRTYCDGFACSAASVIFMAGYERYMNDASLLMIHNAWRRTSGNAKELRKAADDLDTITQASIEAYKGRTSMSEDDIRGLMDAETWILPDQALEMGFATHLVKANETNKAAASARTALFLMLQSAINSDSPVVDEAGENETPKQEPPGSPEEATPPDNEPAEESTPPAERDTPPAENKTMKFVNALLGGKDE